MHTQSDATVTYGLEIQVPYPGDTPSGVLTPTQTILGTLDTSTYVVTPPASSSMLSVPAPVSDPVQFQVRLTNAGDATASDWKCIFYQIFCTQQLVLGITDEFLPLIIFATPFEANSTPRAPIVSTSAVVPQSLPGLEADTTDLVFAGISQQQFNQNVPPYNTMSFRIRFMTVIQQTTSTGTTNVYVIPGDPDMIVTGSDAV